MCFRTNGAPASITDQVWPQEVNIVLLWLQEFNYLEHLEVFFFLFGHLYCWHFEEMLDSADGVYCPIVGKAVSQLVGLIYIPCYLKVV